MSRDAAGRRLRARGRASRCPGGSRRASCAGSRPSPSDARLLLLVAAAEPIGDPLLLWRAAERLGHRAPRGRRRRRRTACSRSASGSRSAIRSCARRSTDRPRRGATAGGPPGAGRGDRPELDPDRRAWHLAAAAAGPDEAGRRASSSARPAGRRRAAALAAAAAFLQRAVALTGDPARRGGPRAGRRAGEPAGGRVRRRARAARHRRGRARSTSCSARRLDLLRAEAAYAESRGSDAPALLLRAAKTLEPLDPKLARETYLDAWSAALFAGRLASAGGLHDVSREARPRPRPPRPARPSDLLLDGFSLRVHRRPRRGGAGARSGRASALRRRRRLGRGGAPLGLAGDSGRRRWCGTTTRCLAVATRGVELAREAGALARARRQRQRAGPGRRAGRRLRGRRRRWSPRPTASRRPRAPASRRTAPSCSPASRAARPRPPR